MASKYIINWFELAVVALLTFVATAGSLSYGWASLIGLMHTLFLIGLFVCARAAIAPRNQTIAHLLFTATVLVLVVEILIQQTFGLHLNLFILSLVLQPDASGHIGVSLPLLALAALGGSAIAFFTAIKINGTGPTINLRKATGLVLAVGCAAQVGHAVLYFEGKATVMAMRRSLPFFYAPHPYHIKTALTPILGSNGENPFAAQPPAKTVAIPRAPLPTFNSHKNILLIVTDSLRSTDIAKNPALTPNIVKWAKIGWLNLDHYSVSNCTHFSMYSLLTGVLPSNFSREVERKQSAGMFPAFEANGYKTSTSEAASLDWYGLPQAIFPESTHRTIEDLDDAGLADQNVTENTVDILEKAHNQNTPFFHLAYYFGTHFPYSGTLSTGTLSTDIVTGSNKAHQIYLATIRRFDTQFGHLMASLEAKGLLRDTLVIPTSDHGDEIGENGVIGHASKLTDAQVRVPLLVIGAGQEKPPSVQSHTDLLPYLTTLLSGEKSNKPDNAPIVLANCSYEYPDGFALIDEKGRFEFSYDDGYLTPMLSPNGAIPAPKNQLSALRKLTTALANSHQ
ncbi:MAG: sulfatase-like hydrolase/transferase [Kordiimonadaceae bacterium]|nr:sulfatase-like hydrolase/transferase [Kordiimonadaceae bacterium]